MVERDRQMMPSVTNDGSAKPRRAATGRPVTVCALAFGAALCASSVSALSLVDCNRTTHVSHGGEADHLGLGDGRVMWREWWSQEGTATDFAIVDCGPGTALRFRTQEENMSARLPFDRTGAALAVVARHEAGARAFATPQRMAADLDRIARDIRIETLTTEPCACAALYPQARGDKTEFVLN